MNITDEGQLDAYLETWFARRFAKRNNPWFRGVVSRITRSSPPYQVQVIRNGESRPDGGAYAVAAGNYVPHVGDDVDLMWRDEASAYVMAPQIGAARTGWVRWSSLRLTSNSADTTTAGGIVLPTGYAHAMVVWSASDTTANTTASFIGLQIGVQGGAINTTASYSWTDYASHANPVVSGAAGSGASLVVAWNAAVSTGGGLGAAWASSGYVHLPFYSRSDLTPKAFWDMTQVNSGDAMRREGAGYYNNGGQLGPVTKLHFFAQAGLLAAGSTFDVLVI